jgi:hypothetical protein
MGDARTWWTLALYLAVCTLVIALARAWLRRFSKGPLETLWAYQPTTPVIEDGFIVGSGALGDGHVAPVLTGRYGQLIRPRMTCRRRDGARLVGRGASDNVPGDGSQPQRGLVGHLMVMVQEPVAWTSKI